MAKYRQIHIEFWQDGFVLDLTPEEKYFYIYLMTNSKTSQCGIYELPKRIIETETGYNRETVEKLLARFAEYEKIKYNEKTKEIFMMNWIKYNWINSIKVIKCIEKELKSVKTIEFLEIFHTLCKRYGYGIDTDSILNSKKLAKKDKSDNGAGSIPYAYPIDSLSIDSGEEEEQEQEREEEQEQEREEEQEEETSGGSRLFSQKQNVSSFYQNNFGPETPYLTQEINYAVEEFGDELVIEAMKITLSSGKRTWSYCKGILKNWRENNVKTLDDVAAVEAEFEHSKGVGKHGNSQTQYHQHKGHPEPPKRDSLTNGAVGWLGKGKREVSQVPGQASDYL